MFHFNQAQMRRFQKIPDSTSDEVLQVPLSSVYGLPFLPIVDVLDAWTELKTRIWILYPTPAITDYITYFEKTWIFSTSYPISMWNIALAVPVTEIQQDRTDMPSHLLSLERKKVKILTKNRHKLLMHTLLLNSLLTFYKNLGL